MLWIRCILPFSHLPACRAFDDKGIEAPIAVKGC
jgi:hypothetical protein